MNLIDLDKSKERFQNKNVKSERENAYKEFTNKSKQINLIQIIQKIFSHINHVLKRQKV